MKNRPMAASISGGVMGVKYQYAPLTPDPSMAALMLEPSLITFSLESDLNISFKKK